MSAKPCLVNLPLVTTDGRTAAAAAAHFGPGSRATIAALTVHCAKERISACAEQEHFVSPIMNLEENAKMLEVNNGSEEMITCEL